MKGVLTGWFLFLHFAKSSFDEITSDKLTYLNAFVALVILDNLESVYPLLGMGEESASFIALSVLGTLVSFVVLSQVVLIQKNKKENEGVGVRGELKYFVPTFLLYNLYYSFLFFAGLVFLIIPGFYVLFYFSMAPLVAVLDNEAHGHFFKRSRELVKKNLPLVIWTSLINLGVELLALLMIPLQDPTLKVVVKSLFSIPDAFFTVLITVVTVKVYYYLRDSCPNI